MKKLNAPKTENDNFIKFKLTCSYCENYTYPYFEKSVLEKMLKVEKVGYECSKCKNKIIISNSSVSYDAPPD